MYKTQNTRTTSIEESLNRLELPETSILFDDNPQRLATFPWLRFRDTDTRQHMDNGIDVRPVYQHVEADSPAAQPVKVVVNDRLHQQTLNNGRGELVATGASDTKQKANSYTRKDKKSCPDKDQKQLRAAEARHRLELLEEERELQDNLAEFWDRRFDKPRRRRLPQETWYV